MTGRVKWTSAEETVLIDLALSSEEVLTGQIKGHNMREQLHKRDDEWKNICDILNSQFTHTKRDVEGTRKKFQNLKQRLKEKIDERRKDVRKTGGGPKLPELSPVEEALSQSIGHRPGTIGLPNGIDTCTPACDDTDNGVVPDAVPVRPSASSTLSEGNKDVPESSGCTSNQQRSRGEPQPTASGQDMKGKKGKRKTVRELADEENLKNIRLDSKRIENEMKLQEEKMKTLSSQREMMDAIKLYFQLKTQTEFTCFSIPQSDE